MLMLSLRFKKKIFFFFFFISEAKKEEKKEESEESDEDMGFGKRFYLYIWLEWKGLKIIDCHFFF